jgi:Na+-driven multidrug efflux pump
MEVLHNANSYILIHSIGATASIMGMVAQTICLASLDLWTPAIAVISGVSNLLGGYFLTRRWGSNGAAAATALATVTSATVLSSANRKRLRNITAEYQTSTTPKQKEDKEGSLSFLAIPDKNPLHNYFNLQGLYSY